jgi:phosphatidylserine/phosphatidylglycerophosphate/cardiolipin synthase-like enzyme
MTMHMLSRSVAGALLLVFSNAHALQPPPLAPNTATGSVNYAFTPDDRADDMIIEAIAGARRQVLVQAFSFTHRRIAEALIKAHSRGAEVVVIADYEQTYQIETSVIGDIADGGVPVLLDAQHASAHNKIMVIDGDSAGCAVITGSYNYTHAAQFRNAENAVILKGNPALCGAFRRNWNVHKTHSQPYRR